MKWLRTPAARGWSDIEACTTQFDDVVAHLEAKKKPQALRMPTARPVSRTSKCSVRGTLYVLIHT